MCIAARLHGWQGVHSRGMSFEADALTIRSLTSGPDGTGALGEQQSKRAETRKELLEVI